MGHLEKGDVFGFHEILKGNSLRMNKIKALEDTFILFMPTKDFKSCFTTEEIGTLIELSKIKTAKQAIDEIIESNKWNSVRKKAVVTAALNKEVKPHSSLDFVKRSHDIQSFMDKVIFLFLLEVLNG